MFGATVGRNFSIFVFEGWDDERERGMVDRVYHSEIKAPMALEVAG